MDETFGHRRRALICGVSGEYGAHLAQLLLDRGYHVGGTSRDANSMDRGGSKRLGTVERVPVVSLAVNDFRSILQTLTRQTPDDICNFAGQTSVGLSFEQPVEAIESLYSAGSSECFGDTDGSPASELTPFRPRSPYAVAKVCAHRLVSSYREAYGIAVCTGVLFDHESPLRPQRSVTQKIVRAAFRFSAGLQPSVRLGRQDTCRDWAWAPDHVDAMWRMLQPGRPSDHVICTGRTVSLAYFVERAFSHLGLDGRVRVEIDDSQKRPCEIPHGARNAEKAAVELGSSATLYVDDVIHATREAAAHDG